ncbi:hypothetical protein CR105_08820 [Massilia eurypsychrophila]|uniref:Uncharacterized protein n=1 Tax=Massilia eurypsychrophila TaxID=1485217 RepID=A0A2G8TGW9_9BURK|nr:hypothetical protein CR105_08820 [Massilia eurypsychrophila]
MPGWVDPDADEVLIGAHLVAPPQRTLHAGGLVVPGADAKHEGVLVDQQLDAGAQVVRGPGAVARFVLDKVLKRRRVSPLRFGQRAVDNDGGRRAVGRGSERLGVERPTDKRRCREGDNGYEHSGDS